MVRNKRFVRNKPFEISIRRQRLHRLVYKIVVITTVNITLLVKLFNHLRFEPTESFGTSSCGIAFFTGLLAFRFTKQDTASAAGLNRAELTDLSNEMIVMPLSNFGCFSLDFLIDIKRIVTVSISILLLQRNEDVYKRQLYTILKYASQFRLS